MRKLLLLLPILLLSSCYFAKTKTDIPWTPEAVGEIEVGKTTKAQVLELLGAPTEVARLLDSDAYIYRHSIEKETGMFLIIVNTQRIDAQHDAVTVIINRKGIVEAVGSRFHSDESSYGMPWGD